MTRLHAPITVGLVALLAIVASASEPKPGNIAPFAKASASSTHPQYPLSGVNDSRMETQWGTDQGKTSGQWLQLEWSEPQEICGVACWPRAPGRKRSTCRLIAMVVGFRRKRAARPRKRTAVNTVMAFKPVRTKAAAVCFRGRCRILRSEVYSDPVKWLGPWPSSPRRPSP